MSEDLEKPWHELPTITFQSCTFECDGSNPVTFLKDGAYRVHLNGWVCFKTDPRPALADALSALREKLAAVEGERDKFRELFGECQLARDTAGFVGSVPQCIEFFEAAAEAAEDRATAAVAREAKLKHLGGALANCAYNLSHVEILKKTDRDSLRSACADWDAALTKEPGA